MKNSNKVLTAALFSGLFSIMPVASAAVAADCSWVHEKHLVKQSEDGSQESISHVKITTTCDEGTDAKGAEAAKVGQDGADGQDGQDGTAVALGIGENAVAHGVGGDAKGGKGGEAAAASTPSESCTCEAGGTDSIQVLVEQVDSLM